MSTWRFGPGWLTLRLAISDLPDPHGRGTHLIGLGEVSCSPRWSGEDQMTAAHFINTIFGPLLTGHDPRDVDAISLRIGRSVAGNPFTKASVEIEFNVDFAEQPVPAGDP